MSIQQHSGMDGWTRLSGAAYLVVIALPVLGLALVDPHLQAAGDPTETVRRMAANAGLFRLRLAMDLVMYTSVLAVSGALYVLLREHNRGVALLALLFRGAEAVLGVGTVLVGAMAALAVERGDADPRLIALLQDTRAFGMQFLLPIMSIGAVLFGLLMWRARTIPRGLNAFGIACYAAIFIASFVNILTPRFANWTVFVFGPGTLFELSIGVWLLARGANREASIPGFRTALIA